MAYVIEHQILWLLLTAIAAGVAGWAFHRMRTSAAVETLERQRDDLRKDLLGFVNGGAGGVNLVEHERETDLLRTRVDMADGRVAALEKALEDARSAREEALARVSELERTHERIEDDAAELERLRVLAAETEARRAAELEVEAEPAPDATAQRWRMRYLESRVRYLEGLTAGAERTADDLAAARQRIADLEEAPTSLPVPAPTAPASDAALNPLRWQARYLGARVRFLENAALAAQAADEKEAPQPLAASAPNDEEAELEQRRRWRLRYLETRLAHVEEVTTEASENWTRARAAMEARVRDLDQALADRDAQANELNEAFVARGLRIAELEPVALLGERARRLTWRARYAEARVRQLEEALAAQPAAPVQRAAPVIDEPPEPTPLVARGQEVRPSALPAARNGAPDDFTLIEGVSPLQQTTLNSLGFYHYDQLAAWSPANVAWVDQYLRLKGRISEERWVEQAAALAQGAPAARAAE